MVLDVAEWAREQFGACDLGDKRRTQRAVKLAAQVAARPEAGTPQQTENWAGCKAAYRLFDQREVTFEALIAPHCVQTKAVHPGTWLILNDTTELDYGVNRHIEGLGPVGGWGRGFLLHTAMIVGAEKEEVVGLAAQELFTRPQRAPRESSARRKQRPRESEVWGRVIDAVGSPPEGARFIHVCDRGADNFEVYCHLRQNGCGWVLRAAQLHRLVDAPTGPTRSLDEVLQEQAVLGRYELLLGSNRNQPARKVQLEVRVAHISMPRPKHYSGYVRGCGLETIEMRVIEAREVHAPRNVEPLRWVLLTSEDVQTFDDAWRILEWYEKRPLIEEYHKCLKTGCRVEARQYETAHRLAAAVGVLSIVAVRLLQLKMIARRDPDRPARQVVPCSWLEALRAVSKSRKAIRTAREFFHALAMLGGFLARRGDGEPGWQTTWRGLETLLTCLRGAQALNHKCG